MSPLWLPPNALGPTETNLTAAARVGTTITAGGSAHTKGSWIEVIASTAEDAYGITVMVTGVAGNATVTSYLLDIGVGGAGSEAVVIQDLDCWGAPPSSAPTGVKSWFLPLSIAKGSRVAARAQALSGLDVASVGIHLHEACNGWGMEVPVLWERLGAVTNSNGVSVTPANGAFGSWTTILDPITKNYRWFHVGLGGNSDSTHVAMFHLLELGIGDTSAAVTRIGAWTFAENSTEAIAGPTPNVPVYQPLVDDDAKGVFARMAAGGTEARSVLVYAGE